MGTKEFWMDVLERAVKTMAQAAIGVIGGTALFDQVDWWAVLMTVLLSGITSVLMSIASYGKQDTISEASLVRSVPVKAVSEKGEQDEPARD